MLACPGEFHDYYREGSSPLPYEVASVSNDIRDFCNENNGEVKRVGNYLIGKNELGEGMFAKVKKGIHTLTGELVRLHTGGVAATHYFSAKCLLPASFVHRWLSK